MTFGSSIKKRKGKAMALMGGSVIIPAEYALVGLLRVWRNCGCIPTRFLRTLGGINK